MGESRSERTSRLLGQPGALADVCSHVSNGGALPDLCKTWDVRHSDVSAWIGADATRKADYDHACKMRDEWTLQEILSQLRMIGSVSIKDAFNEWDTFKSIHELSPAAASVVASVKIKEELGEDGTAKTARVLDIKFHDKIKAIEILLRDLGRLIEKRDGAGTGGVVVNVITGVPQPADAGRVPSSPGPAATAAGGGIAMGPGAVGGHPQVDSAPRLSL